MTVQELHLELSDLIDQGKGNIDVAINLDTFVEGEDGENIAPVEVAKIQCVNYTGLMDEEENQSTEDFFVLQGLI